MATATRRSGETEVAILARILGDQSGRMSDALARHFLELNLSESDKARMHELAVRNQDDALSQMEKEEMLAFAKAASLLSILKSKARRTLRTSATRPPKA
ncbi:hypothetical protein [Paludisphaera soli]|uniref:hypothetical protein n=1 Tax=Paludisphaera soli TaxID=2712865 RepID=UPI0013E9E1FE|nr:hypothetical protein [Paludisphaera soli]